MRISNYIFVIIINYFILIGFIYACDSSCEARLKAEDDFKKNPIIIEGNEFVNYQMPQNRHLTFKNIGVKLKNLPKNHEYIVTKDYYYDEKYFPFFLYMYDENKNLVFVLEIDGFSYSASLSVDRYDVPREGIKTRQLIKFDSSRDIHGIKKPAIRHTFQPGYRRIMCYVTMRPWYEKWFLKNFSIVMYE